MFAVVVLSAEANWIDLVAGGCMVSYSALSIKMALARGPNTTSCPSGWQDTIDKIYADCATSEEWDDGEAVTEKTVTIYTSHYNRGRPSQPP